VDLGAIGELLSRRDSDSHQTTGEEAAQVLLSYPPTEYGRRIQMALRQLESAECGQEDHLRTWITLTEDGRDLLGHGGGLHGRGLGSREGADESRALGRIGLENRLWGSFLRVSTAVAPLTGGQGPRRCEDREGKGGDEASSGELGSGHGAFLRPLGS
jgi:hypothetical protein